MKKTVILITVLLLVIGSGCGPTVDNQTTQTAFAAEVTDAAWEAFPTDTVIPTRTSTPTKTPKPTRTMEPTETVGQSATQAPEPTAKPTPGATKTAITANSIQAEAGRFFEDNGPLDYSYIPPEGWIKSPDSEGQLAGWLGPSQTGGIQCVMAFNLSKADSTASEAGEEALKDMPEDGSFEILENGVFPTLSGVDAYRIIILGHMGSIEMIVGAYMFSQDGYLLTTAYMRLAGENPEQDALVDASLATLRFE